MQADTERIVDLQKKAAHFEKVYALFMNFLSALYDFSDVMVSCPPKERGKKYDLPIQVRSSDLPLIN